MVPAAARVRHEHRIRRWNAELRLKPAITILAACRCASCSRWDMSRVDINLAALPVVVGPVALSDHTSATFLVKSQRRPWSGCLSQLLPHLAEAAEIYVKKIQERRDSRKRTLRTSRNQVVQYHYRQRREGNLEREDDVEIEKGDKKGRTTEESWSMSEDFISRSHESPCLELYDSDNDTVPIPLKSVDVIRQTEMRDRSEGCQSF